MGRGRYKGVGVGVAVWIGVVLARSATGAVVLRGTGKRSELAEEGREDRLPS